MLLEVKSLKKSFTPETAVVDGVSLIIEEGEIVCLLGPSGCGKTTLLRMIAGLERPDAGEVLFEGKNIVDVPPHQRDFGMMFQDFALFPHKNVRQNVVFGLQMRGDTPEQIEARVTEMLSLVDLTELAERDIVQLSGGEQQRVALARSLAPGPRLLMLDEPLGALDRALRERLMLELRAILKRVGVTAVYVTHDQTEAFAIADRVVVMNQGRIEQVDKPQTIYARPATPFVARFLGFQNIINGEVVGEDRVSTPIGQLQVNNLLHALGTAVILLVRPTAANLQSPISNLQSPIFNQIEATLTAVSFRGRFYQVWFQVGAQRVMFELKTVEDCEVGQTVQLVLSPDEIQLL